MTTQERRVAFEGLVNFRDLGGYATASGATVRWGRVYRSDALHRMTESDAAQLREIGMTSVIDLRAPDEVAHVGTGFIDDVGARYQHLPTRASIFTEVPEEEVAEPESAAAHYLGYLTEGRTCFGGVVQTLSHPDRAPAVFFCNAGKDRTGVVAAMVLALLGVDDDSIALDYALTEEVLDRIYAVTQRDYPVDVKAWRNLSPDMRYARAETMLEFLDLVRTRVGGWEAYVLSLGVPADAVASMRAALLEGPASLEGPA